ncbi:MAG: aconitase family protein, partial [Gallionellaceae bacterium]
MTHNPFNTRQSFTLANGKQGLLYSLPALEAAAVGKISRLPVSIRVVLEAVLRNCDGKKITEGHVRQLANWQPNAPRTEEIPFVVARIVLQDFTGVPLLADLAAMRDAAAKMGKDPKIIEPLVPVNLVVDHSVQVDYYNRPDALRLNMEMEFERNTERYKFMKWGMQAFDTFKVVPPGVGIVHQVNLEYLARGVLQKDSPEGRVYYPDTLVGTDSHTTMINGIGVVGWGVGGIEAEAGMLGQPVYFLTPDVVGVHLKGKLREGVTATDLVLTVTELLRKQKVVGKFVEFFGAGAAALTVPDRATIANMAPEYGATMGFFPVDDVTVDYMRNTGRTDEEVDALSAYFKAQNLYGIPQAGSIDYSSVVELDLASIEPSLAGPKRPQDRVALSKMKEAFNALFSKPVAENGFNKPAAELGKRYATA